jgi:hypothetical protein
MSNRTTDAQVCSTQQFYSPELNCFQMDALQAVWCYPEIMSHLDDVYNTFFRASLFFLDGRRRIIDRSS